MRPDEHRARIDRAWTACLVTIAGAEALCRILAMPETSRPTRHGRARATGRPIPRRRHVEGLPAMARTRRLTGLGAVMLAVTRASMAVQLAQAMATPIRGLHEAPREIILRRGAQ